MFCPGCGKQNEQGATFCNNCGFALQNAGPPEPVRYASPTQQYTYQPQGGYTGYAPQPPKSKSKGLMIGLIIGGVVLVAAAVVLVILLTGGVSITGLWYNEEYGEVIEFKDNGEFYSYTAAGETEGEYRYDRGKGEGTITWNGVEYGFKVKNGEIEVDDTESYVRADKSFDIDEFLAGTIPSQPSVEPSTQPSVQPSVEPSEDVTPASTTELSPLPTEAVENVTGETMTLQFDFGERTGLYTGEVRDGLPDGYGVFEYTGGETLAWTYEGDWKGGHFEGQGQTSWEDGYAQSGEYHGDYLNGQGTETWYGRLYYQGEFLDSVCHGQGTLYNYFEEPIYSGGWSYGYIQETPEDRSARLDVFKSICYEGTAEDFYAACEAETESYIYFEGEVFDVYEYGEGSEYYVDILIYESGIEERDHIVQVFYRLSEGEPFISEGQYVSIWGTTGYLYSYTTEGDEYITVPMVEAWSVE